MWRCYPRHSHSPTYKPTKILDRIPRVRRGNLGDHRHLDGGLYELSIHYGAGYPYACCGKFFLSFHSTIPSLSYLLPVLVSPLCPLAQPFR